MYRFPTHIRQIHEEVLNVHLANSLRAWATNREPLLRKHTGKPFVAEIAGRSHLPLVLSKLRVTGRRKNEARSRSQEPGTSQFRAGRDQRRQDRVAEAGYAMKIAFLIHIRRRVHHLEHGPCNKIPVVGERKRQNRLKLEVHNITDRACSASRCFPEAEAPRCSNRIRQFLVNLVERFAVRRLRCRRSDDQQARESDQGNRTRAVVLQFLHPAAAVPRTRALGQSEACALAWPCRKTQQLARPPHRRRQ